MDAEKFRLAAIEDGGEFCSVKGTLREMITVTNHPYAEEIAVIDQHLFQIKNAIKYSVSVHSLKSALVQNAHRLKLQAIKDLLMCQSNRIQ